jgi:hypothetical protein
MPAAIYACSRWSRQPLRLQCHAGHVHHLAETSDPLPLERGCDLRGPEHRARVLEPRQGRHARGNREEHLQRQPPPLFEHPPDPLEAEHVRHLVVVDEDRRRPVREHRFREAADRDHHRLDVEMRVDQPGHEIRALGVEHAGLGPAGVPRVAEHRDAAVPHRDVDVVQHLARVDVDEAAARDQQVCRLTPHADGGE